MLVKNEMLINLIFCGKGWTVTFRFFPPKSCLQLVKRKYVSVDKQSFAF